MEIARVQLKTWRTGYPWLALPDLSEDDVAAAWSAAMAAPPTPHHLVMVALEGTQVVGFAASGPAEEDDAAGATELTALVVEPRWGRRGHGSRLLAACVDTWRPNDVATAVTWLWVRDDVTSAFLLSAGWEPDGTGRALETPTGPEHQRRLHVDLRL